MIPGVLILSPFAGAGGLMHEALMANPYETNIVAEALDRALSMELDERKMRMNQLKKREKRMDVDAWVRGFMAGMSTLNPRSVPGNYFICSISRSSSTIRAKTRKKVNFCRKTQCLKSFQVEGSRRRPGLKKKFQKMLILVFEVIVQSPEHTFEIGIFFMF